MILNASFTETNNELDADFGEVAVVKAGGGSGGGEDGFSPVANVKQTASGAVISITDKSGTTTATITNGKDGYTPVKDKDYFDGQDGITPHIGTNGNWFIGNTDTGVNANGSGGADWNAIELVPVLEETTIPYSQDDGGAFLTDNLNLVVGQEYSVFWNGVEYVCTAVENAGRIGLGDIAVADDSVEPTTGEPFVIGEVSGSLPVIITNENVTEITLSIYHHRIHKLDNKYLDMSWIPSNVGEVILPEQICNGSLKAIDAKYRVEGTPIIAFVDGIPYESVIAVDGVDTFANFYFGVNSMVSLFFFDTSTGIFGDYLKGRSVKICLREYNKIPEEHLPVDYINSLINTALGVIENGTY